MDTARYPIAEPQWASFWLRPDGKLHKVPYGGHWLAAESEVDMPDVDDDGEWQGYEPDETLQTRGWVHISIGALSLNISTMVRHIRDAQVDALYDILSHAPTDKLRQRFIEDVRYFVADFAEGFDGRL